MSRKTASWFAFLASVGLVACSTPAPSGPTFGAGDAGFGTLDTASPGADAAADTQVDLDVADAGPAGGDAGVSDAAPPDAEPALDIAPAGQPQLQVKIKGVETQAHVFQVNPTIEQKIVKAAAVLKNVGSGPLLLQQIAFATDSPQLTFEYFAQPLGPADFPYTLLPDESLQLDVLFHVQPPLAETAIAKLHVVSNDAKQPDLTLVFSTPCVGGKPDLGPGEHVFVNAKPTVPKTKCFGLVNLGCAESEVQSVQIVPADAQYQLLDPPKSGHLLPEAASLSSPPTPVPVCVRFTPAGANQPSPVQLVVTTKDIEKGNAVHTAKVGLSAAWQPPAKWRLTCAAGAHRFDFQGVQGGSQTRKCQIVNEGSTPVTLAGLALLPATEQGQQAALDAAFQLLAVAGGQALALPAAVAPGKAVDLALTLQVPAANPPLPALVEAKLQGTDLDAAITIPVSAGACAASVPVVGPSPVRFHAAGGATATRTVLVGNQGCTPLQLVHACTTKFDVTQAEPCETGAASTVYFLQGFSPQAVAPWSLLPLEVQFKPQGSAQEYGQLHLYYCTGLWQGGACTGGVKGELSIPLEGTSQPGLVPPSLTGPGTVQGQAGRPVLVGVTPQAGTHPLGNFGAFQWQVQARPAASNAWLYAAQTDGAELLFLPDVPGAYTLTATVVGFQPGDLASISSSTPITIPVQVD